MLVVFLGFWMVTDPSGLADTAQASGGGAWDVTQDLFTSVIDFLKEL